MAASDARKLLAFGLKTVQMPKLLALGICMTLNTDEMRWEFLDFLVANPKATHEELVSKAMRIIDNSSRGDCQC